MSSRTALAPGNDRGADTVSAARPPAPTRPRAPWLVLGCHFGRSPTSRGPALRAMPPDPRPRPGPAPPPPGPPARLCGAPASPPARWSPGGQAPPARSPPRPPNSPASRLPCRPRLPSTLAGPRPGSLTPKLAQGLCSQQPRACPLPPSPSPAPPPRGPPPFAFGPPTPAADLPPLGGSLSLTRFQPTLAGPSPDLEIWTQVLAASKA